MKPVWKTIDYSGDGFELASLFKDEPGLFFLDSSLRDSPRGRYSLIGFKPFEVFSSKEKDSIDRLRSRFYTYAPIDQCASSPLSSGIVGFLSYDFGLSQDNIKVLPKENSTLPDCFFGFYSTIMTIDHYADKVYVSSTGFPERNGPLRALNAQEEVNYVIDKIKDHLNQSFQENVQRRISQGESQELFLRSNFTKEQYVRAVRKALDYIAEGDVYQVNLSQKFELDLVLERHKALEIYRYLRKLSPSYSGAYFNGGEFQILSSSPEQFLRLHDGIVQTKPMKGTRPRSDNASEDRRLKEELLYSLKDKAELLMVTDLERNDLGKVCEFGSVSVTDMRSIESYQTVYQATSTVQGKLRKDKDCFDILKACFPSGSITGCPKIRSMEIIEELEPSRRGIYTGCFGYISFSGEMDFNILIRTILAQKNKISFHAGSGIVSDSAPEQEYEETLVKAKAMLQSLKALSSSPVSFYA